MAIATRTGASAHGSSSAPFSVVALIAACTRAREAVLTRQSKEAFLWYQESWWLLCLFAPRGSSPPRPTCTCQARTRINSPASY